MSSFTSRFINQFEYWSSIVCIDWGFVQQTAESFQKHGMFVCGRSLFDYICCALERMYSKNESAFDLAIVYQLKKATL